MHESQFETPELDATALFRHLLATLAHRFAVAVRDAPAGFADYLPCPGARSPGQILAHLNVLIEWSTYIVQGSTERPQEAVLVWDQGVRRFFALLKALDEAVQSADTGTFPIEKLLQGPLADALTHIGQLTMLRRMASSPVQAESYFRASVRAGNFDFEA